MKIQLQNAKKNVHGKEFDEITIAFSHLLFVSDEPSGILLIRKSVPLSEHLTQKISIS